MIGRGIVYGWVVFLLTWGAWAAPLDISVEPGELSAENILRLNYSVHCKGLSPGLTGTLVWQSRTIRFELFASKNFTEISLGSGRTEAQVARLTLDQDSHCELKEFSSQLLSVSTDADRELDLARLALIHSPYLAIRDDQHENRLTDLPLDLAYSVHIDARGNRTIRYTLFMSDEDSESTSPETDKQMARYGRRTDIEWLYEVKLSAQGSLLEQKYQGDIIGGAGHLTREFAGEIEGNHHPVLYNIANHNVFSDSPRGLQASRNFFYRLVPRRLIESPLAREVEMFREPWMFRVSDLEMAREGKLSRPSGDWLYVLIDGELNGAFVARLTLSDGTTVTSGGGHGDVDRLGEDLWERQAYTAIPLDEKTVGQIAEGSLHGSVGWEKTGWLGTKLRVHSLRFFRLRHNGTSFDVEDITSRFDCGKSGSLNCRF